MRAIVQRWTAEDDERLKIFVARGASLVRAAAGLKRGRIVVRERARKLGCPFLTQSQTRKQWADSLDSKWRKY